MWWQHQLSTNVCFLLNRVTMHYVTATTPTIMFYLMGLTDRIMYPQLASIIKLPRPKVRLDHSKWVRWKAISLVKFSHALSNLIYSEPHAINWSGKSMVSLKCKWWSAGEPEPKKETELHSVTVSLSGSSICPPPNDAELVSFRFGSCWKI